MPEYEVKDRRPISNVFRLMGYGFVDVLVRKNVHPNTISYFSVVFACVAGAGLYFSSKMDWLLLVAPVFGFLRLYCNMIDGMVAVKANKCSATGEVINELPDRISDTLIFLGLGLSGLVNIYIVFGVIFGMLFGTYIGVLSKAVGANRQFGGIMSKQNRMFMIAIGCWAQFFVSRYAAWEYSLTLLDIFNIIIIAGLVQTILLRTVVMFRELGGKTDA